MPHRAFRPRAGLALPMVLVLGLGLTACDDDDDNAGSRTRYTLQLLHFADVDGDAATALIQNAPRFSGLLNHFREQFPNTLLLSSGDNFIPGPTFAASDDAGLRPLLGVEGAGRGDILILNALGVQASALGNHEFDNGPGALAGLIAAESVDFDGDGAADGRYPGTAFPYLSANIDFSADPDLAPLVGAAGQAASAIPNRIAASAVVSVGGEAIGVVGATTPTLAAITSTGGNLVIAPADPADRTALAAAIQAAVDALTDTGIDKVILLAHMQQIAVEKDLAPLLRDVDIIVAGGSNTYLADATDRGREGQQPADTYPLTFTSASGEPVLLVNTDGDYRYLGRLVVDFDERGVVLPASVDPQISGAWPADDQTLVELGLAVAADADPDVLAIAGALEQVLIDRESNTFGRTSVYLDGRRAQVRTQETNLGNLTADANLFVARQFDPAVVVSIKNGGGIRDDIGEILIPPGANDPGDVQFLPPQANPVAGKAQGRISQFDIQNALRFDNRLVILTVSARQLRDIVEHGVSATAPGATPGRFPQVGGLRFSFDPARPPADLVNGVAGERVRSLAVLDAAGAVADVVVRDGAIQGDPERPLRLVTLNFLANDPDGDGFGGDGYPFPQTGRVDLDSAGLAPGSATFAAPGGEQDALAEYLLARFPDGAPFTQAETPASADTRIQNLAERTDGVLAP